MTFAPWALLWLVSTSRASCDHPTAASDVQNAVETIEAAFGRADSARFAEGQNHLDRAVNCLDAPLPRYLIAAVHRQRGIRAWVEHDPASADAAFAAAKALEPDYRFPDTILPDGHPILAVYQAAAPSDETVDVPAPASGTLWFDGRAGEKRPTGRAVVAQVIDDRGRVLTSSYLFPQDRMPVYTVVASEPDRARRPATAWWATAGVSVLLSGVSYGIAIERHGAYDQAPIEGRDRLRQQTNGWVLASAGWAAVAAGTGVVALVDTQPKGISWRP